MPPRARRSTADLSPVCRVAASPLVRRNRRWLVRHLLPVWVAAGMLAGGCGFPALTRAEVPASVAAPGPVLSNAPRLQGKKGPRQSQLGDYLRPRGFAALPLRTNAGPHLEITAQINGVSGRFLLDTGAQITVVNTTSLKKFRLSSVKTGVRVYGAIGGPGERIGAALASRLKLGPCEFSPFLLGVSNLSALNQGRSVKQGSGPFDGIIGTDVLQNFSFVIDCAGLKLYARPSDSARSLPPGGLNAYLETYGYNEVPLKRSSISDFEVLAKVNGRDALWLVDTGAAITLLDVSVSRKAGIKLHRTPYSVGGAGGGRQQIAVGIVDTLRLHKLQVRGAPIAVSDISSAGGTGPQEPGRPPIDGYLGADFLREKRAIIDCARMKLYLRN